MSTTWAYTSILGKLSLWPGGLVRIMVLLRAALADLLCQCAQFVALAHRAQFTRGRREASPLPVAVFANGFGNRLAQGFLDVGRNRLRGQRAAHGKRLLERIAQALAVRTTFQVRFHFRAHVGADLSLQLFRKHGQDVRK